MSIVETTRSDRWRSIAWNGIGFSAPAEWEIGRIGLRYLELEVESGPVMEIKWNTVKGRFSQHAHLRRLAGLQKRHLRKAFQQMPLPASWETAVQPYDASGFSWKSESGSGKGVLLYNPTSRVAALIQFHRRQTEISDFSTSRLLTSFREQTHGVAISWAVFDIRAEIPIEFQLQRFRFEAGKYELLFSHKHHQLQMMRWSPAAVILRRKELRSLALDEFAVKEKPQPQWLQSDATTVAGQVNPGSAVGWFFSRIRRRPAHRCFCLWHEVEKNRILGVQISGRRPVDRNRFETICRKYETI